MACVVRDTRADARGGRVLLRAVHAAAHMHIACAVPEHTVPQQHTRLCLGFPTPHAAPSHTLL
jgi:hypothetical protein